MGIRADKSEVTLATIPATPQLGWNPVPVDQLHVAQSQQQKHMTTRAEGSQDVVSVKYESAPGSFGNIAEIKLYRAC